MHGNTYDTGVDPPMLTAALSYAARGWHVFPAHKSGEKKSHKKAEKTPSGLPWGMSVDAEEIGRDFARFRGCNVAIVTGEVSGLFVLEC
ncbi:bifunctional DNA primase/polymerase, partial [Bradyrhizobium sp. AUGA SZCCT0182]|uniref:bifunctional DNA primase/polymerase n=1 Tax=Bradyrhizobium sp. AUGA SZCCT0182 TaxID=2807667 RepID=UPI001BA9DC6F